MCFGGVFKLAFFNGIFCSHGKKSPLLGNNGTVGHVLILSKGVSALRVDLACLSTPGPSRMRSGILFSLLLQMFVRDILFLLHLESELCHIPVEIPHCCSFPQMSSWRCSMRRTRSWRLPRTGTQLFRYCWALARGWNLCLPWPFAAQIPWVPWPFAAQSALSSLALCSTECSQFPVECVRISTSVSSWTCLHAHGACVQENGRNF